MEGALKVLDLDPEPSKSAALVRVLRGAAAGGCVKAQLFTIVFVKLKFLFELINYKMIYMA